MLKKTLQESIEANDTLRQLIALNNLSTIYKSKSQIDNYFRTDKSFLLLSQQSNTPHITLFIMNRLAETYMSVYLADEAARLYYGILKISDNFNNTDSIVIKEKSKALFGIGVIFTILEVNNKALDYFDDAHRLSLETGNQTLTYKTLLWKGRAMQNEGKFDSARHYFNESLELSIMRNSRSELGEAFLNIGKLEIAKNNLSEAEINLANAYNTLKNTSDKVNLVRICFYLGDLHLNNENYDAAEKILKEAAVIAQELNIYFHIERVFSRLSKLYESKKQHQKSIHYRNQANIYAQQLLKSKVQTNLLSTQMEYEAIMKEQEIVQLNQKYASISKIKNVIIVISVVAVFLFMAIFLIYYRYMMTKRKRNFSMIQNAKMKSEFFKQLSDEIRTPVTIIGGLAEKLKNSTKQREASCDIIDLDIIEKQSKKISSIVNEILTVSNLKFDDNINWIYGNIVHFIQFLYNGYIELAKSRSVDYLFHSNTNEIKMDYSKDIVSLVINNLLNYLLKQSVKDDRVALLIREDTDNKKCHIELTAKNSFVPIEEISKSIDLYYQRDVDSINKQKVNEYLVFSKHLVKKIGGRFVMSNTEPSSITFIIELPIKTNYRKKRDDLSSNQHVSINNFIEANLKIEEHRSENKLKPNILIVEDNSHMTFYLSSLLTDGYNVWKASNAKEALSIATEKIPHLIIADCILPQIGGKDLSILLKNNLSTSHIPIIMITAQTSVYDKIDIIKSGVDSILQKPFDEKELLAIIDNLLINRNILKSKFVEINKEKTIIQKEEIHYNENIDFIQKVTDIIYREIHNNDYFPEKLAEDMYISSTHLNRKIKAVTGMNTMSYVNNVKLNRAKKLLTTSQRSIGDIAMESGFSDFSYFSRSFKKEFGITPSQFQRSVVS